MRKLSKQFKHYLEVNFEEEPDIKHFFEGSLNPDGIIEKLSAYYNVPVIPGENVAFFG